jgi:serine protease inhibitor
MFQFNTSDTIDSEFLNDGIIETQVKMMSIKGKKWRFNDSIELQSKLIEIPLRAKNFSFFIVLPHKTTGLKRLKSILSLELLREELRKIRHTKIDIFLPKFKVQITHNLESSALNNSQKLIAFTNEANISRINRDKNFKATHVLHRIVYEIDETGGQTLENPLTDEINPQFRACHPFLYLIYDSRLDSILLIGQINKL